MSPHRNNGMSGKSSANPLVSQGIDITADKNIKFIFKCLEEKAVGYYQMFGERIPAVGFRELFSREKNHGILSYRKSIQTLEKYGYQNREGADKAYGYNKYRNTLELSAKYEVFNTKYPGTLSGYRWLYRREKRFARKYQYTLYYDRYGA